jgi:hypothetical protein
VKTGDREADLARRPRLCPCKPTDSLAFEKIDRAYAFCTIKTAPLFAPGLPNGGSFRSTLLSGSRAVLAHGLRSYARILGILPQSDRP